MAFDRSATGKRAALLQEYVGYIERVPPGEAGKLEAGKGETTQACQRRRLNAAATALGRNLEFLRTDTVVYFWPSKGRRCGRPRKNPADWPLNGVKCSFVCSVRAPGEPPALSERAIVGRSARCVA